MTVLSSFNGGEVSPLLRYRVNLDKYSSSCSTMENFTVLPQGGAENRPGTEFIAFARYPEKKTRLIPFKFNLDQVYMLEFGDCYVRVIGAGVDVETPYSHETLRRIVYVQSADVMFLVHPDYPPAKLSRYGETDWRYETVEFRYGPFMEENRTAAKVTPSGTGGEITLSADDDIFEPDMAGMIFELTHPNMNTSLSHKFEANGVSETMPVSGSWQLTTTGGWYGTLFLQRSFDNGENWQDYRDWTSARDRNVESTGIEARENVIYRLKMTNWTPSTETVTYSCSCTLSVEEYWIKGIVRIDEVVDARTVRAAVIEPIGSTDATADWAFGAWNERNGYPTVICFFEDRLCFANTAKQPLTIWHTITGDYNNLKLGDDADSAMTFTIRSQEVNAICWMLPQAKGIVIGNGAGEGLLFSVDDQKPLTPETRKYSPETQFGNSDLPALMVNDTIIFIQRGGEHVRELAWNFETDGYQSPDMTVLAEHILRGGALETAFKPLPFPVIYYVRTDGQLIGFTYERLQNVIAWHRHTTQGTFESAAVLSTRKGDELWVAVRRNGKCCIERFYQRDFETVEEAAFLDCSRWAYDTQVVDGLEHLEGCAVEALADGSHIENLTVISGQVTLPRHAERVLVGLQYTARCETMPLEFMGANGDTLGLAKKVTKVNLMYHRSLGGRVGTSTSGELQTIDQRKTHHVMNSVPPLQTGQYEINLGAQYTREETIIFEQDAPLPLTVLALTHNMGVYGK